ncbi:MAG TPA: hypothetical protein VF549_10990 [Solirubrobacteraceae bacterium]|jgi:hypothetical protein
MKRTALLLAATAALATASPASAAAPRIVDILSTPGDGGVNVVVTTRGPVVSSLHVCDVEAIVCVPAQRMMRRTWVATLPAGATHVGVIGRCGAMYALGAAG